MLRRPVPVLPAQTREQAEHDDLIYRSHLYDCEMLVIEELAEFVVPLIYLPVFCFLAKGYNSESFYGFREGAIRFEQTVIMIVIGVVLEFIVVVPGRFSTRRMRQLLFLGWRVAFGGLLDGIIP